jgi:hypothetical protein
MGRASESRPPIRRYFQTDAANWQRRFETTMIASPSDGYTISEIALCDQRPFIERLDNPSYWACNKTQHPDVISLYRRSPKPWDGDATALQSKQQTG